MKREAEQKKLYRMAKVHNFWEMWQASQNLRATEMESHAQNMQMTAVEYIADTEEIVKASWSNFHHDGAAVLQLSERSPVPPALSAKNLPGRWTLVLNVHQIKQIDRNTAETDEASASESISDTEYWLYWNGDLDSPNDSEDDCEADNKSKIELDNGVRDSEAPEQWDVSAAPNVPRLIRLTWGSRTSTEKVLMTDGTMETSRNEGIKTKLDRMSQCIFSRCFM